MTSRKDRWAFVTDVVAALNDAGASSTRTQIQKQAFLLSKWWAPSRVPYEFVLHLHGPYSFDLDRDIAEMEAFRALERRSIEGTLGARYGVAVKGPRTGAPEFAYLAVWLGPKVSRELEALATCEYVWTEDRDTTVRKVREIKPHLGVEEIAEAYAELGEQRAEFQRRFAALPD